MSFPGLFAFGYPPPVPYLPPTFLFQPTGERDSCCLRCFTFRAVSTLPFLQKEASGPPQFPSYPFENMPWSKTPVVTPRLAIAPVSLLPSVTLECVGFPPGIAGFILMDHNYTFFGAQYRACNLVPSSFRPPSPVLPVDFTNELPAKLCSCGTYTHWVTLSNFILLFG